MRNRRNAGQEGYRESGMQVRRDAGKEGCRKGGMQEKRDAEMEGCSKGGIPPDCKDLGQSKEILGICLFYQTNSPRTLFKVLISLRYRCPYRVRADCWGGGGGGVKHSS